LAKARYEELGLPEGLSETARETIKRVADLLHSETNAVAVLLTGPHAMGIERSTDKMYFVVITDNEDGVIEHRFLKQYSGIEKEMEIGIFPRKFTDTLVARGYWDMVSYRAAEALRTSIPLLDRTAYGGQVIAAMAEHIPERRFVSGHIHKMIATYDDAMSLYSKGDYEGAVLVVREALRLAIDLVLKTSARSPEEAVDETVKRALGEESYVQLLRALDAEGTDSSVLRKRFDDTLERSKAILKDAGIPDDFLEE
jgi:hypothetical protein